MPLNAVTGLKIADRGTVADPAYFREPRMDQLLRTPCMRTSQIDLLSTRVDRGGLLAPELPYSNGHLIVEPHLA